MNNYYYTFLNNDQKIVYNTLKSNILSYNNEFDIPKKCTVTEFYKIYDYLLYDIPLIFFTDKDYYPRVLEYQNSLKIFIKYFYSKKDIKYFLNKTLSYIKIFDVLKKKSEIAKEFYVHAYCLNNFTYDKNFGEHCYSVMGLVLEDKAVCSGIAKFVKLALDYLKVTCVFVSGRTNREEDSRHAWNIVKIGRHYYNLDVTWNLKEKGPNKYDYFNLSDEEIKISHEPFGNVPKCLTSDRDYYTVSKMYVNNINELTDYFISRLKMGEKHIFVKIKNTIYSDDVYRYVIESARKSYKKIYNNSDSISCSYNIKQMIFEISFK